jgi:hypothetical protein
LNLRRDCGAGLTNVKRQAGCPVGQRLPATAVSRGAHADRAGFPERGPAALRCAFRAHRIGPAGKKNFVTKGARMENLLLWIGRLGGIAGIAITAIAIVARLQGTYMLGGFQIGTLLQAGIAAMVAGCLGYTAALAERPPR